jgi:hypothetical protein
MLILTVEPPLLSMDKEAAAAGRADVASIAPARIPDAAFVTIFLIFIVIVSFLKKYKCFEFSDHYCKTPFRLNN